MFSIRLLYACAMPSDMIGDFNFWVERVRRKYILSLALLVALTWNHRARP
jgi:hypothetical protein